MYQKILLGLIAILATFSAWSADRPNILLVYLDDVGKAWFPPYAERLSPDDLEAFVVDDYDREYGSFFGSLDVPRHIDAARTAMPFLDSLAQQSMVFDQAFSSSSLCAPSRAGLMAASYQQRFGLYGNTDAAAYGFPTDQPMLVEALQNAGYATAMIGKWHLAKPDSRIREAAEHDLQARREQEKARDLKTVLYEKIFGSPSAEVQHPFDRALGYYFGLNRYESCDFGVDKSTLDLKTVLDDMAYRSSSAKGQHPLDRGFDYYFGFNSHDDCYYGSRYLWENHEQVPERPVDEYLTDLLTDRTIDFINQSVQADKPFFVYLAPLSVHGPLQRSPEKYAQYFDTGVDFSDWYAGHLRGVDENLKRIYSVLREKGVAENTLLIFSADNGQTTYRVPPYNAPYKGGKGTRWLGGSGVPLIVSMPAKIKPGFTLELISTIDILPTVLDIAGVPYDQPIDGLSFRNFLTGQAPRGPRDILYSAGLQSTEWSLPYDMKVLDGDRNDCPLYAWAIDQNGNLLTHTSSTPAALYPEFPQGRDAQRSFHSIADDPDQSSDLNDDSRYSASVKGLDHHLGQWLSTLRPPLTTQKKAYRELLQATP